MLNFVNLRINYFYSFCSNYIINIDKMWRPVFFVIFLVTASVITAPANVNSKY